MINPRVSFIIPTFRRPDFLKEAIDSVLNQDEKNLEIVVIDDDPVNNSVTSKIIESYNSDKIVYIQNRKNLGPGYSRQAGLSASKSAFVVFMDDDDFYVDTSFVSRALSILENQQENIAFVAFNAYDYNQRTGEKTKGRGFIETRHISKEYYIKHFMLDVPKPKSTFTAVFNKKKLYKSGISEVKMLNDTVIYLRALISGDAVLNATYIGCYRVHQRNITKTVSADFIVRNLNEKVLIAKKLSMSGLKRQIWLYNQSKSTILYFMSNSDKYNELPEIQRWIGSQNFITRILLVLRVKVAETQKLSSEHRGG
ncbi:glycosyltransferase family 2 protein [Lacticaseibacillus parakribbianus]|uniref:glycosyltransferase family 2 protein n=1 Tax=Lacticaseibacillus parakribbianus TaxID=2970927 RepID=UPI0021CB86B8|nr:glycosyltransferase family 2 protein [Lacticaseibacillus parakribbianus]